jgi:hypothetical protein
MTDNEANLFLDRDPEIFKHLLYFLRNKKMDSTFSTADFFLREMVKDEFDYFCVSLSHVHFQTKERQLYPVAYVPTTAPVALMQSKPYACFYEQGQLFITNVATLHTSTLELPKLDYSLVWDSKKFSFKCSSVENDIVIVCVACSVNRGYCIFHWEISTGKRISSQTIPNYGILDSMTERFAIFNNYVDKKSVIVDMTTAKVTATLDEIVEVCGINKAASISTVYNLLDNTVVTTFPLTGWIKATYPYFLIEQSLCKLIESNFKEVQTLPLWGYVSMSEKYIAAETNSSIVIYKLGHNGVSFLGSVTILDNHNIFEICDEYLLIYSYPTSNVEVVSLRDMEKSTDETLPLQDSREDFNDDD